MTIAQQLIDVNQAKQDIKTAIEAKGVSMAGVTFPDYHTKIAQIQAGSGGTWTPDDVKTWDRPTHWPAVSPLNANEAVILTRLDQQDDGHQYENYFQMDVVFDEACTFYVDWGDGTTTQKSTIFTNNEHVGRVDRDFDWNSHPGSPEPATGYKVSVVKIYGVVGNVYPANIVKLDFTKYAANYYNNQIRTKFLEIHANTPSLVDFILYNPSFNNMKHMNLEYVNIIQWGSAPSIQEMFQTTCIALGRVDLPVSTHGGTAVNPKNQPVNMFYQCYSLKEINGFNMTGLDGNMQSMFRSCHSLQFIPFDIDFTNFSYSYNCFYEMRALLEIQSGINIDISNHGSYGIDWNAFYQAENDFFNGLRPDYPDPNDPEFQVFLAQDPAGMFNRCNSLQATSTFTFADTATYFDGLFYDCYALLEVPTMVAAGTNTYIGQSGATISMGSIFRSCSSLKTIPADLFGKPVINIGGLYQAFYGCSSLAEIHWAPTLHTSSSVNFQETFYKCHALHILPDIDTSTVGSWNSAFYECYNIVDFPSQWNLHSTQNNYPSFEKTFFDCHQMKFMPGDGVIGNSAMAGSTSYGVNDLEQCFYRCYNLEYVGQVYTRGLSTTPNCQNMFTQCRSLKEIGSMDLTYLTGTNNTQNYGNLAIDYLGSLTWCDVQFPVYTQYYNTLNLLIRNNNLSAAALNNIFNNLPTNNTGRIRRIYIGGNPGTLTCTQSIATSKNWTIVT